MPRRIQKMTRRKIANLIRRTVGPIMSVTFIKRGDGSERSMLCRRGVVSHLKGGSAAYSFKEKKLISVYEMSGKRGYKCIPIEGIEKLVCGRRTYVASK